MSNDTREPRRGWTCVLDGCGRWRSWLSPHVSFLRPALIVPRRHTRWQDGIGDLPAVVGQVRDYVRDVVGRLAVSVR